MTWLIVSGIILTSIFILAIPFFHKSMFASRFIASLHGTSSLRKLKEEKANLLLALKELDFDYETGKLSKEDYKELRDKYQALTVETLKNSKKQKRNGKTFR